MNTTYQNEDEFLGQGRTQEQLEKNNWCAGMSVILFAAFIMAALIYAFVKLFIH